METLLAAVYRDAEIYRQEGQAVFGREWSVCARGDEVAAHRTAVAKTIAGGPSWRNPSALASPSGSTAYACARRAAFGGQ